VILDPKGLVLKKRKEKMLMKKKIQTALAL
jgi:hypothetical protein